MLFRSPSPTPPRSRRRCTSCHALFGNRVNHGEGTFHTLSPNRRHSALIHRLHRARETDSSLKAETSVAQWRRTLAGADTPKLILPPGVEAEDAHAVLELPPLPDRQALLTGGFVFIFYLFLFLFLCLFGLCACYFCVCIGRSVYRQKCI